MMKTYEDGILIGFFHKGKFMIEPSALIIEMRLSQSRHKESIEWLEKRIQLLVAIQKVMVKRGGDKVS